MRSEWTKITLAVNCEAFEGVVDAADQVTGY